MVVLEHHHHLTLEASVMGSKVGVKDGFYLSRSLSPCDMVPATFGQVP